MVSRLIILKCEFLLGGNKPLLRREMNDILVKNWSIRGNPAASPLKPDIFSDVR